MDTNLRRDKLHKMTRADEFKWQYILRQLSDKYGPLETLASLSNLKQETWKGPINASLVQPDSAVTGKDVMSYLLQTYEVSELLKQGYRTIENYVAQKDYEKTY